MNTIIQHLKNHRSIRAFQDREIPEDWIQAVLESAQAAPSFLNGQQVTFVDVRDKSRKDHVARLCGDQDWIRQAPVFFVLCMDFHRADRALEGLGQEQRASGGVDALLVGAVDAGLYLANAGAAAESLGLGYVPIGGVRKNAAELAEFLGLPPLVFPVVGMALGFPAENPDLKPRLPLAALHHRERYQAETLMESIDDYNGVMKDYMMKRSGGKKDQNWSQRLADMYTKEYYPGVRPALEKQGFGLG